MSNGADWTEGYTSEVDYTMGFYRELSPLAFEFAAQLRGMQAPRVDQAFRYFEIGCGHGYSLNLHAAANPQGTFIGNDFNPLHVANARGLAEEAELSNVTFLEKSFAELLEMEFEPFDFIALHGVYSWITRENRQQIVEFIRRNLRSGGAAYISYNSHPGWAPVAPLRRLMTEKAAREKGSLQQRIDASIALAEALDGAGAKYFQMIPSLKTRLGQIKGQNRNYIAHEYFNQEWNVLYHADVVQEVNAAKLNFIGSVNVAEQFDQFAVISAQLPLLAAQPDPVLRETVKDFLMAQQFRRDLFVRGAMQIPGALAQPRLLAQKFVLQVPRAECTMKVKIPIGEGNLDATVYEPLLDRLAEGPASVSSLATRPEYQGKQIAEVYQQFAILCAVNYVLPTLPADGEADRRRATDRFNRIVMQRAQYNSSYQFVASPVTGTGHVVDRLDFFMHDLVGQTEEQMVKAVAAELRRAGQNLTKDGKVLSDPTDEAAELATRVSTFISQRLPLQTQLGLVSARGGKQGARR
ncbi:class I SAM-dependent methyltransferase [Roseiterribacter gracilis]|uniref:Methyltransferase n=1 Tax=Roseiterribacter gracilis TaxID=2812848 RepID=A0A8S8XBN9_9PROT|nr:hypothetical protein TMPK1_36450 [Rhodospirillales bacterium TMPK1]